MAPPRNNASRAMMHEAVSIRNSKESAEGVRDCAPPSASADWGHRLQLAVDFDGRLWHRAQHAALLRHRTIAGLGAFNEDSLGIAFFAETRNLIMAEIVGDNRDRLAIDAADNCGGHDRSRDGFALGIATPTEIGHAGI